MEKTIKEPLPIVNNSVEFISVCKKFGSLKASDNVTFSIQKGTVHCILGENGAGKSTLMKILFGAYRPDSGIIKINGVTSTFRSSHDAIKAKIGMLYQHFMLIEDFTVLENVILGNEITKAGILDLNKSETVIKSYIDKYKFDINLTDKISSVSIGAQQKTELLKLLYRDAEILILDEPTAVLSPVEIESFFQILSRFKAEGKTVILITHKLKEVEKIADSVTILRKGRVVYEAGKENINETELAAAIIGNENQPAGKTSLAKLPPSVPAVELKNVTYYSGEVRLLDNLNLIMKRGEIHGICGVEGNGQESLTDIIAGIENNYTGSVSKIDEKISLVPDDRIKKGLIKEYSIGENFILKDKDNGWVSDTFTDAVSENIVSKYNVNLPAIDSAVKDLSGGNQQKVIIAREIEQNNDILIFSHPTRGVDINAAAMIHSAIIEERNKGKAVLVISSEIDELIKICDIISVIYRGKIVKEFKREKFNNELLNEEFVREIGKLMIGIH